MVPCPPLPSAPTSHGSLPYVAVALHTRHDCLQPQPTRTQKGAGTHWHRKAAQAQMSAHGGTWERHTRKQASAPWASGRCSGGEKLVVHMSMWPKAGRRLPLKSPVPLQTWRGRAHSTCGCGRGEPQPRCRCGNGEVSPAVAQTAACHTIRPSACACADKQAWLWHAPNKNAATSAV